jgi:flavodoxin
MLIMLMCAVVEKENVWAAPYISERTVIMNVGQTHTLKMKNAKKVKWSSSDKKVATVSKKGEVKARKAGQTTITAKVGKKKYKSNITVSDGKAKTLIVYFSATGNTKTAAKKLQKVTGADMIRLQPKKAYSKADLQYNNDNCRANKEQEENKNVTISTSIKNLKQYQVVCLGYSIWWGREPGVIRTFLSKNNLSGKTVMPFCTSGSSGISGSMSDIRKLARGADVKDGKDLTDATETEIRSWINATTSTEKADSGSMTEKKSMVMTIGSTDVPVAWENNKAVEELNELARPGLTISMSGYGGFEQVGSIGKYLTADDREITTSPGDIVLYNGNKLVVFYGSNTWEYTRLGKIELSKSELTKLLGNGDVTITINMR